MLLNLPILAGKRDSSHHSTTSFNENVVVMETSFKMLEVLSFYNWERAQPFSMTLLLLTLPMTKRTVKLPGCLGNFETTRKKRKLDVLVVESIKRSLI